MQWVLEGRRVLRRGSKKGLSRRHLGGRNTPFREYDPLGVHPNKVILSSAAATPYKLVGLPSCSETDRAN